MQGTVLSGAIVMEKNITIHGSLHSKVFFFFFFCPSKKPTGNRTNGLQLGFVGEAVRDLFL